MKMHFVCIALATMVASPAYAGIGKRAVSHAAGTVQPFAVSMPTAPNCEQMPPLVAQTFHPECLEGLTPVRYEEEQGQEVCSYEHAPFAPASTEHGWGDKPVDVLTVNRAESTLSVFFNSAACGLGSEEIRVNIIPFDGASFEETFAPGELSDEDVQRMLQRLVQ